jgi:hypothetical protein
VHTFCSSLGFLVEAQPRLKTGEYKKHFLAKVLIKFFRRPPDYKAKGIIGKITNLFCIYFFYGDRTIIAIIICDIRRRIRH